MLEPRMLRLPMLIRALSTQSLTRPRVAQPPAFVLETEKHHVAPTNTGTHCPPAHNPPSSRCIATPSVANSSAPLFECAPLGWKASHLRAACTFSV